MKPPSLDCPILKEPHQHSHCATLDVTHPDTALAVRCHDPMPHRSISRREALRFAAKLSAAALLAGAPFARRLAAQTKSPLEFNVLDFGAVGDGRTPDTAAIQRAIDTAAASGRGARVLVPGGRRYLIGSIQLKGATDFHLADDAELFVSTMREDYDQAEAAITAFNAEGLSLSGTGSINGRSPEFMMRYEADGEWWIPGKFRPRLALLTGCKDLSVRDVTFTQAPNWTLHLLGCDHVQVDRVKIRNQKDVPNCDGIDPDHCRKVEITRCDIICGDDPIVIKASRRGEAYGGSAAIRVSDCVTDSRSSGVKIGTETTRDITNVRFERCEIRNGGRGCCIQLRDEGNVHDVLFRDITFTANSHATPWWGRGEAISFTAMPRMAGGKVGKISGVRVENVTGRAENSVRLSGSTESRIEDVTFDNVEVMLDRWSKYPGQVWDNRPTTAYAGLENHATPGIHVRFADNVALRNCRIKWGPRVPEYFTHALEAHDVSGLTYPGFTSGSAHPGRDAAVKIL
jgi:polygalacturonase